MSDRIPWATGCLIAAYQLQLFYPSTNMTANHIPSIGGSGKESAELSVTVLFQHSPGPVFFKRWIAYNGCLLVGEEIMFFNN